MYRLIRNSNLPKWLKLLIDIALTLTVIYWLGYMFYKIVDILRIFLHTLTEKKIFWIEFGVVVVAFLGVTLFLQFNTEIKVYTNLYNDLLDIFNISRDFIADKIHS